MKLRWFILFSAFFFLDRNCKIKKATRHQQECPDPPDVHLSCSDPGHFRPPELQRQLLAIVLPTIILCTIGKKRSSKLSIILYKQCFDYGDSEVTMVRLINQFVLLTRDLQKSIQDIRSIFVASFIFNFNRPLWMKNKRVALAFLDAKDEHLFIYGTYFV